MSNYHRLNRLLITLWALLIFRLVLAQAPPGYYNSAQNLTGQSLQLALHNIIKDHTIKSYDYLWTAFAITDTLQPGNICHDMYSYTLTGTPPYVYTIPGSQCSTTPGQEGVCYNREHTFPKSWFGGEVSPMFTDLFHVTPSDSYVNTRRSNYPYGVVNQPTWTSQNGGKLGPNSYPGYTGTVFEPINEYKGDLARHYFYMVTRYADVVAGWETLNAYGDAVLNGTQYPAFEEWTLSMLMEWHTLDPVSAKEINRNNAVYSIQGNRNPYIDHPEFAWQVWPEYSPVASEPSEFPGQFSAHNIHLQWEDAAGEVLPTAYLLLWGTSGFEQIQLPADGTPVPDGPGALNVPTGVQSAWVKNLLPSTVYYFKLISYTGEGSGINYKLGADIPQYMIQTGE